jgi:hypothetical protein
LVLLNAWWKPIVDYEVTTRVIVRTHIHHEAYCVWFGDYAVENLVFRVLSGGRLRSVAVVALSLGTSVVVLGHCEVWFPLMSCLMTRLNISVNACGLNVTDPEQERECLYLYWIDGQQQISKNRQKPKAQFVHRTLSISKRRLVQKCAYHMQRFGVRTAGAKIRKFVRCHIWRCRTVHGERPECTFFPIYRFMSVQT